MPPNRTNKASVRYQSVIDAKAGVKKNDISKTHKASHFCRASVSYALEMVACFNSEVSSWSVDDKNKLLVGSGPCVDRRMSFKTFFLRHDVVHYPDHNFATSYKVIPSGYMQLLRRHTPAKPTRKRSRSTSPVRSSERTQSSKAVQEDPLPCQSKPDPSKFVQDKLGRLRYRHPRTGPLTVCL